MTSDTRVDELFQLFLNSNCSLQITDYFKQLCDRLSIDLEDYYNRLPMPCFLYDLIRQKFKYWKADEIWSIFQKKADHKDHILKSDNNLRVLIIGCGPVGLRLSIELALMGIKCHIVEKRDRFSRNNVLHLWPFTIVDLNSLGAKKFYGKFCIGSIDHISKTKSKFSYLFVQSN
jgi:F-actin monooxygenase